MKNDSETQNANPEWDSVSPMADASGDRNLEQLLSLAQGQRIEGAESMDRAELVEALKAVMSPEELFNATAAQKAAFPDLGPEAVPPSQ